MTTPKTIEDFRGYSRDDLIQHVLRMNKLNTDIISVFFRCGRRYPWSTVLRQMHAEIESLARAKNQEKAYKK